MTPEKRARMVMVAAYVGPLGTALLALSLLLHLADFLRGLGVGLLLGSLVILLWRKLRDEYFEQLWAGGASWAFAAVVIWALAAPIFLGTFEGSREVAWQPDLSGSWTLIVALAAFFAGFHLRRLRGAGA